VITRRRKLRNVEPNDLFAYWADVREVSEGEIRSMQWEVSLNCNANELCRQTQYFNAMQQCATWFGLSEPSSRTFITKGKRKGQYICYMQILRK